MDEEKHLKRLQHAVLKWHEWQTANYPPLADLGRANPGSHLATFSKARIQFRKTVLGIT
jgi:hypothetical protein